MKSEYKRIIIEILVFILMSVLIIYVKGILDDNLYKYDSLLISTILNVCVAIIIGGFINAINKKFTFKIIKFKISNFIIFICCILVISLLWILYGYLPNILTKNLTVIIYLLSLYAGANLFSSLFMEK